MTESFDIQEFLPYVLNRSAEAASLGFQRIYKARYGMLRTEWRVLFHLGRYGEMTAREICDRSALHKTKVSRAVRALEDKRFVSRKTQSSDRRRETLSLTRAGHAAYRDLVREARLYENEITKDFSDEELAILRHGLFRLTQ